MAHARHGAEANQAAVNPDDPPVEQLRAMLIAMMAYLGERPGTCAGFLGALGATGQMSDVLQTNDTWIAATLRELLMSDAFRVPNVTDAANAIIGAVLLGVL